MNRKRYAEFLMASQINYTQTYFAEHSSDLAHDAVRRYLLGERVTAGEVWKAARANLVQSPRGYLIFDDSVLDKNHARDMALVRRQYSGNEGRVIRGIGLVSCVYVNPDSGEFWLIDYRVFAPDEDGKNKHDHVRAMFLRALERQAQGLLWFQGVLMDRWYASNALLVLIDQRGKTFVCPIKGNRRVHVCDDQDAMTEVKPYAKTHECAQGLTWTTEQEHCGRVVHLREAPSGFRVKLFRFASSTGDTELIVTNDQRLDAKGVRETHAFRWTVEQFHRELKQTTGIQACQCRRGRAQRNHLGLALLVWLRLKQLAKHAGTSIYALKRNLLSDYLRAQLTAPTLSFA
jgi:hypothetical protein